MKRRKKLTVELTNWSTVDFVDYGGDKLVSTVDAGVPAMLGYAVPDREPRLDRKPVRHGHLPNLDEAERGLKRSKY